MHLGAHTNSRMFLAALTLSLVTWVAVAVAVVLLVAG